MNLILHVVKKDLRHTWMWILAVSISLAALHWAAYMTLHANRADRNLWANALTGTAAATVVSTAVFIAMLVHAESLCGARAHWLGRPIDWRSLLTAKALLAIAALAPPLGLCMSVSLAAEGFSPMTLLPEIAWRTAVVLTIWVLPLAALATVTNNLQQMALWLVGLFLAAIFSSSAVLARGGFPMEILWVADAACYALIALLGTAIAVWQYATRGSRTARLLLAAAVPVVLLVPGMSPRAALFAAQRRLSPVAATLEKGSLVLDAPRPFPVSGSLASSWTKYIFIPVRLTGLGPGELATLDAVDQFEVEAAGERMSTANHAFPALRRAGAGTSYWLQVPIDSAFFQRHRKAPVSLRIRGQMTLYDSRRFYPVAPNGITGIPGAGRCMAEPIQVFQIRCTAPFRITSQLELYLISADPNRAMALQVHNGDRAPLGLQLYPVPFDIFTGYLPTSHELLPTDRMEISVAAPRSYVERSFSLTGLRMEDYAK